MNDPPAALQTNVGRSSLILRDAALVVVGCALVGLSVNAVRPDGLAWVQGEEYEILVPCSETSGEVERLQRDDPRLLSEATLLVDARSRAEYDAWHLPRAISVVFDYLEPTSAAVLRQIAASGAHHVVVYGDGGDPDSGEQLGRELSGKGIKNVGFVAGGAPALAPAATEAAP
jgi:hypothetical protein